MEKNDNILRLGLILVIITGCAALILALVFNVTKEPIAKQEKLNNEIAMKELITDAESFEMKEMDLPENIIEVNEGKNGNEVAGYTIKVSTKGYAGEIKVMVGINNEGTVTGIKILSQGETPGLGANSTQPSFYGQFEDKQTGKELAVVKSTPTGENEIQAITGATITSKAVTSAVNSAVDFYKENLEGGNK